MKRFERNSLISALLAGSALIALPAMAQDAPKTDTQAGASEQTQQSDKQPAHKLDARKMNSDSDTNATQAQDSDSQSGKTDGSDARKMTDDSGSKANGDADMKAEAKKSDDTSASGKANLNAAKEDAPGQMQKEGEAKSATEAAPGQKQKEGEVDSAKDAAPGQTKSQAADEQPSNETTASVNLTTEKTTEIKEVIHETDVQPVDVDVDVSVGVAIPHKVELHPLPPRIVEIVPAYEGYDYFVLADGRIIIVEPSTYKVVYIISS